MTDHNKLTFAAEYCRCRRIPHRIKGESLFIKKTCCGFSQICFSLYNLAYKDIIDMIDNECIYDDVTTYYKMSRH